MGRMDPKFSYIHNCYPTPSPSHIQKSNLKLNKFSFRSQTNAIIDLQYIFTSNLSQTSTSNSKYNSTYQHLHIIIQFHSSYRILPLTISQTSFVSQIKLKTQQILISLTDKCHYRLTIYLHIKFKPNINLQLQIQTKQ